MLSRRWIGFRVQKTSQLWREDTGKAGSIFVWVNDVALQWLGTPSAGAPQWLTSKEDTQPQPHFKVE
jgi:hypothetical protein